MPYSYATYTGNGSTTQFDLTFPYIRKEHVKVYVNYVDTAFTWANDTRVQLASAPANGLRVEVRRITPVSAPLVDYADGSTLVAADLDTNALQQAYINQEQDDNLQDTVSVNAQGLLDAGGQRITNVGNPTLTQDVATKNYVDGLVAAATIADVDYGDITVSGNATVWTIDNGAVTSAKIADGTIIDGDISTNAEIAVSKLADGAARQLLQTDAAGTGVEWTSNVDVPGTLDVTGAVTLDSTLTVAGNVILPSLNGGPLAGNRNRIINGDMRIAQRGTSVALGTAPTYFVDRFAGLYSVSVTGTLSQQSTGGLTSFSNCVRAQRTSGQTATGNLSVIQVLETLNCTDLAGGSVVLSFWARAGSNYSATSNVLTAAVYTGTGTDQSASSFMSSAWTGQTAIINSGVTLTTSWQKFTLAGSVGASATQLGVLFQGNLTGTAGANDFFEITGVQLEPGTVATPFERRNYGQELALCQRYYRPFTATTYLYAGGSSTIYAPVSWPPMMATPTTTTPTQGLYANTNSVSLTADGVSGGRINVGISAAGYGGGASSFTLTAEL